MGAPYVEDALAFDTNEEQRTLEFVGKFIAIHTKTAGKKGPQNAGGCKGSLLKMFFIQIC